MAASGLINVSNRNHQFMRFPRLRYLIDGAIANRAGAVAQSAVAAPPMIGHRPGRPRRQKAAWQAVPDLYS
jgi:hypothetical protein